MPVVIILWNSKMLLQNPILLVLLFVPLVIVLWAYFGTYYIIKDDQLFYKSAFISGQVDINKIREIIKGGTTWIGIKPATAPNGLMIKFNAHDELYISPENNDSLIDALKKINQKIIVTGTNR